MWWFPYTAMIVNLLIIWFMPKKLTRVEIYFSWALIACINLSSDIVLALYFKMYELAEPGIQLGVHLLELTLSPSYGIIYLNFIPNKSRTFVFYLIAWLAFSLLFEVATLHVHYLTYYKWKLWYSAFYYLFSFLYLRWHLHYIRNKSNLLS